jgi:cold shock CspA family protein
MKVIGHVNAWFDAKNFGFIHENRNGIGFSYFFHRKHLIEGFPATGQTARFNVVQEPKGAVAIDVEIFHSRAEMELADALAALKAPTTPATSSELNAIDVLAGSTNQAVKS